MISALHAFAEETAPAQRLAKALGTPLSEIELHIFPDGESLPRAAEADGAVALYRSLWRPDDKIMPLLLAADALRRRGARKVVLVAPYMPYLRQDTVFHPGEPLSRDVLGRLLGERFDAVVTVEPHLHRTRDLSDAFNRRPVIVLPSTDALAAAIGPVDPASVVIGPDLESTPWAQAMGRRLGLDCVALRKTRWGDREVSLALDDPAALRGRPAILIDDICASGATLETALRTLREAGAGPVDLAIAHALFSDATLTRLVAAGARRIISTDSCPHPTNAAPLADLLATALKELRP